MDSLAERIRDAEAADQTEMLRRGLDLLETQGDGERTRLERLLAVGAYAECALALHRLVLPCNGFELGQTHPGATMRAFAGTWRRGDPQTATVTAATPALALLRATSAALTRSQHDVLRVRCPLCRGRGWYFTARGTKDVCRHGR